MERSLSKRMLKLFFSMLYISAFTFGGGFVIVTFMKRRFVDELHWLDEQEMLDMTALAQSSPGAIAVNAAILVGWKIGNLPGMLVAVLGTVIPPMVILSIISLFYQAFAANTLVAMVLKGMSCGVAAVILDVSVSMGEKIVRAGQGIHLLVMAAAFVATFFLRINVMWIILCAALIGIVMAIWERMQLFLSFLQIGLLSIGGGYAAIPLIQEQTVLLRGWLTAEQFMDLATIAEMTPGPIGINGATFVGLKVAGLPGAIMATLGFILPSIVIVSFLALIYRRYRALPMLQSVLSSLRPAVIALIAAAGINMLLQVTFGGRANILPATIRWADVILFIVSFIILRNKRLSPILVMAMCGAAGLLLGLAGIPF